MKLTGLLALIAAFGLGVFIAFHLVQVEVPEAFLQPQQILDSSWRPRVQELPEEPALVQPQPNTRERTEKPEVSLHAPAPKEPVKLDFSLPKEWDNSELAMPTGPGYPNFFTPRESKRMSISSKLHWLETEEAEALPLDKAIDGAELELQFKLP